VYPNPFSIQQNLLQWYRPAKNKTGSLVFHWQTNAGMKKEKRKKIIAEKSSPESFLVTAATKTGSQN